MIMKNRCFELFKNRDNATKVAGILIHTDYVQDYVHDAVGDVP